MSVFRAAGFSHLRTSLIAAAFAGCVVCGFGLSAGAQAGASGGAAASAAGKRPMTFADLMAMKRVSDPQISASGKWVLFSVTDVSLEKNSKVNRLWVVPMSSGTSAAAGSAAGSHERELTTGSGEGEGRFSPDGKWVAYVAAAEPGSALAGTAQLWVAPWNDAEGTMGEAVRLTSVSTEVDGPVWSPDSQRLLFASRVYPECSDRADEEACDRAKDEAAAKNPVKAQVWDHLLYRHWNQYLGEKRSHVLVVSASDGMVRDLTPRSTIGDAEAPVFSLGGPLGYAWAPDSREVAYVTNLDKVPAASTNNDVFTLRLDEPGAKAVKVSISPGSDDAPAYSPDGRYLAFRSQARAGFESDRFRLMLFDRAAKTTRELMPKFDRWVDEFVWAPDSKALYFASGNAGQEPVYKIEMREAEPRNLQFGCRYFAGDWPSSEFGDLHVASDGKTIVMTKMSAEQPSEIIKMIDDQKPNSVWACSGGGIPTLNEQIADTLSPQLKNLPVAWKQLTTANASLLSQLDLPKMESFLFNASDGTKVEGFLIRPPGFVEGRKYPLKFVMHGGPQTAEGDAWSYRWNLELLAANGYVVVTINRRGSTGYGQKFIDQVSGDWGGKAYTDLMTGLDFAEKKYPFIDKGRECALGASYGGFMANWVLTHTNRFQCIVTHDGLYDPVAAYGSTEELWFNEREFRPLGANGLVEEGKPGQPWNYAELPASQDPFRKFSPMRFIKNAKTPTLVIHSQLDYRLDVSQGFELFTALQRLGVPSKMLYFPDEGHWVQKPRNSELWYATVNDWCDRWTHSGKYAALGPVVTKPSAAKRAAAK